MKEMKEIYNRLAKILDLNWEYMPIGCLLQLEKDIAKAVKKAKKGE